MKMKRKFAALLSVLMILGAFSGCSNTDSSAEIVTPTTTVTTTAAATSTIQKPADNTAARVVLMGYDSEKDTVIVNDPLEGIVEYPKSTVRKPYGTMGMESVAIRKK